MEEVIIIGFFSIFGILIGSIITLIGSNYIAKRNHEYSLEKLGKEHKMRIDFMKKESFFKKKLEYFERIMYTLEEILTNLLTINELRNLGDKTKWKKILDKNLDLDDEGEKGYLIYFDKISKAKEKYIELREEIGYIHNILMGENKIDKQRLYQIGEKIERLQNLLKLEL